MAAKKTFSIPDPVYWTAKELESFGEDVVHDLARISAGTVCSYQVVLGRCLLAVHRTGLYSKYGCSGAVHYGVSVLGLGVKLARTLRRVARGLEALPKLSRAAEQGKVPWGKLREIVPKASAETEDAWLTLTGQRTYAQIQALARCTDLGIMPWEAKDDREPPVPTRYRYVVKPELGELFERGAESVSRKLGKYMSVTESIEYLMVQQLNARPVTDRDVEAARKEASQDAAARRQYNAGVRKNDLKEAQEIVEAAAAADLAVQDSAVSSSVAQDSSALHSSPLDSATSDPSALDLAGFHSPASGTVVSDQDVSCPTGPSPGREVQGEGKTPSSPQEDHEVRLGETLGGAPVLDLEQMNALAGLTLPVDDATVDDSAWSNPRLRFNPKARGVTPAQRREVLRRDGFKCRTPGCPNHAWLEVHHQQPYALHGPTVRANLMDLCTRCHSNEQRRRLKISGEPEGTLRFVDGQGRDLCTPCSMEIAAWLDFWIGWSGGANNSRQARIAHSA